MKCYVTTKIHRWEDAMKGMLIPYDTGGTIGFLAVYADYETALKWADGDESLVIEMGMVTKEAGK